MSHVQDSLSLQGGCIAYLHRPTQGWTVREYILALQSKLASSTVQPWVGRSRTTPISIRRHAGSIEGAFSPCSLIGFPCTQHPSYHQPKGYGEPSLNWLLPSQESSTSWVKRCLRLWLTNLMGRFLYANYVDGKR